MRYLRVSWNEKHEEASSPATSAILALRRYQRTVNKLPVRIGSLFVTRREQVTYKETCYRVTDTNLENDITSEISIVCLTDALLSLIKHGRLVSAAIDLPRP